jgi:hypothetical protein
MDHLTADQLETLRSRLTSERATLLGHLPGTAAAVATTPPDVGDVQDAAATEAALLTRTRWSSTSGPAWARSRRRSSACATARTASARSPTSRSPRPA